MKGRKVVSSARPQSTATVLRHLKALSAHLEQNDFSTPPQDSALRAAIGMVDMIGIEKMNALQAAPKQLAAAEELVRGLAALLEEALGYLEHPDVRFALHVDVCANNCREILALAKRKVAL